MQWRMSVKLILMVALSSPSYFLCSIINPQCTCARGLQYSVYLSVSQSVILSHTKKADFEDDSLLDILSPFKVPEFLVSTYFFRKKQIFLGCTIISVCWYSHAILTWDSFNDYGSFALHYFSAIYRSAWSFPLKLLVRWVSLTCQLLLWRQH